MMYLLFEERFGTGESATVQRTKVRPLDGDGEGNGLAISVDHGENHVDVTFDEEEAREFLEWCMSHLNYDHN